MSIVGKEEPDHIIETVLSHVYFHGDRVFKVYKWRTGDFADLNDREVRKKFIAEDFDWCHSMAPNVYHTLHEVPHEGDVDWHIEMNRIKMNDLAAHLEKTEAHEDISENLVSALLPRLDTLTNKYQDSLSDHFENNPLHIREEVLNTLGWASTMMDSSLIEKAREYLEELLSGGYFTQAIESVSVVIDNNIENIQMLDDGVSFIDVMPPADKWKVHDRYFLICRTSIDLAIRGYDDLANELHAEYARHYPLPPEYVRDAYVVAAALIQAPYRQMIGQVELSQKYVNFITSMVN